MSETPRITVGSRLGPYILGAPIRSEGSSTVFAAHDDDGRPYAVRARLRGQPDLDRRFLRAFETLRLMRASGVVPVYDAALTEGVLWYATDHVGGHGIDQDLHPDTPVVARVDRAVGVGLQLCSVLASLHEGGLSHGGLQPSTVRVDAGGDILVLDCGIEPWFSGNAGLTDLLTGTAPYRAPELVSGLPTDEAVDIYAAGVILHEAIAGPRAAPATPGGWLPKICLERLPDLATRFTEVPRGLAQLLQQMTSVDPRDRPTALEAASALRHIELGAPSAEWPEAPFIDPGDWWEPVQGCIGNGGYGPIQVLEGPAGSGRTRIAEQVHRLGLLTGIWTIHLRCREDRVGGPLLELIRVLVDHLDDASLADAVGETAPALRHFWPELQLPVPEGEPGRASNTRVVEAVAATLERLVPERPMLLVFHDLERVDPLTQRALARIAALAGPNLGLLLIHEIRWANAGSRQVVQQLRSRHGAAVHTVPALSGPTASALARALCPVDPPVFRRPTTPYAVLESSYRTLATWRREAFEPPEGSVWPLTVRPAPVPEPVFEACVGPDAATSPWVRHEDRAIRLAGPTARRLALPRLTNLKRTAAALATAWEGVLTRLHMPVPGELACLWRLGGELVRAWEPGARAAIAAERSDQFAAARRWLLLLDTLEQPTSRDQDLEFDLAYTRARVSLYTDATGHPEHTELAEGRARTDAHRSRARLLRAERALRLGEPKAALVKALRAASPGAGASSTLQLHAVVLALHARIALDEGGEIERELARAEVLLEESQAAPASEGGGDPLDPLRLAEVRAELAFLRGDLLWCRGLCQDNLRSATHLRYVRGAAQAALTLGRVLRMLGRRSEAEQQIRAALHGFTVAGDPLREAEAELVLGTLLAERGQALPARHLVDQLQRRIRRLGLDPLAPQANRLALQVAALIADRERGRSALRTHEALAPGNEDPEWPAVLVRWFRRTGEVDHALAVPVPSAERCHAGVLHRVERAWAALSAGERALGQHEARIAVDAATALGLDELALLAGLVHGAAGHVDDEAWSELQRRAAASSSVELVLGALQMDAGRHDPRSAHPRWRALLARARELGYLPAEEEARARLAPTT